MNMVQTLVFSLVYGPVAVTLGCWFFCTIGAARARQEAVVLVSSQDQRRLHPRSARVARPLRGPRSQRADELVAKLIVGHTPLSPLRRLIEVANGAD